MTDSPDFSKILFEHFETSIRSNARDKRILPTSDQKKTMTAACVAGPGMTLKGKDQKISFIKFLCNI